MPIITLLSVFFDTIIFVRFFWCSCRVYYKPQTGRTNIRDITNFWQRPLRYKSLGISDFEWCSLHWWPYKSNSCNKNCWIIWMLSKGSGFGNQYFFKFRLFNSPYQTSNLKKSPLQSEWYSSSCYVAIFKQNLFKIIKSLPIIVGNCTKTIQSF